MGRSNNQRATTGYTVKPLDLSTLQAQAEAFRLHESEWFNYWHAHVDWHGEGDRDPELRRACLVALATMLKGIQRQLAGSREHQLWMQVAVGDAGQDAVYVHTPNPHSEFPHAFEDVTWDVQIPPLLEGIFDPTAFAVGRSGWDTHVTYWIRPRDG